MPLLVVEYRHECGPYRNAWLERSTHSDTASRSDERGGCKLNSGVDRVVADDTINCWCCCIMSSENAEVEEV
jgi:hypothetical protein